jgi:hypothetical protein
MIKSKIAAFLATCLAAGTLFNAPKAFSQTDASYSGVVFLDQGWTEEDRLQYYFTSQGSAAMSYDLFLHLEVAKGDELFRSSENMTRYGFVPYPADPKYNPDGLPVGFAKTALASGPWKGAWVGLGCAACHNGQLQYNDLRINISGGTAVGLDFYAFLEDLNAALEASLVDNQKFDRLADKIGGDKADLRARLANDAAGINQYITRTALTGSVAGPGRMDALGLIHNQVQARALGVPENWRAPLAPVKPSFVWNIPQSAWAQWTGVLPDPLFRNHGEVLGVFARMDLTSKSEEEGLFTSTVDLKGQILSENLLRRLAPPKWPEEQLGPIDRAKAAQGAVLFAENCSSCHSTWPHRWSEPRHQGKRFIENAIVGENVMGTDPGPFRSPQFDFLPTAMSGPLSARLPEPYTGDQVVSPATMFRTVIQLQTLIRALEGLNLSPEELASAHAYGPVDPEPPLPLPALNAYKANPIEGMWSAPPFLHNGSVPNLYELLIPASERSKTFYVGRGFDPLKVGVDTTGSSGKFLYDTALVGNSNQGHSFENGGPAKGVIGRLLSEDERWALIEFVKSVPNEPSQISPFGGPQNPVRAWLDETFYHVRNPGTYDGAPKLAP